MSNKALLIVDVQTGFIDGQFMVHDAPKVLRKIKGIIERARSSGIPVIYVQHSEDLENDGPIHPLVFPSEGDHVIEKLTPDAFYETNLEEVLGELDIGHLVIAGFQTDYCINSTSRKAKELGYKVTIIMDAHSTIDSDQMDAPAIIAEHNARFLSFAELVDSEKLDF